MNDTVKKKEYKMKKYLFLLLIFIVSSQQLSGNILPKANEWQVKLEKTNINNKQQQNEEYKSQISPVVSYGLNDLLSFNIQLLRYEDKLEDPNETREIKLGANYTFFKQDLIKLSAIGGVKLFETEVNDDDRSGTSFFIGSNVYYNLNKYVTALAGLEYFTEPSDIPFNDNLLEKIGVVFTPTDYLDLSVSYEFTDEAISYGISYFFNF